MCLDAAARSRGEPLSPALRRFFEGTFNRDFKEVRIHRGDQAHAFNREFGALAFAYEQNVFFRRGAYAPDTPWGLWLLAHELAHVLQLRGPRTLPPARVAPRRRRALEWEANLAASTVLRGRPFRVPPRPGCPSILPWGTDMHLVAVYWTGRMQGAAQRIAIRAAVASQSLDDDETTAAPPMKAVSQARQLNPPGFFFLLSGDDKSTLLSRNAARLQMRRANNSHALGVTYDQSEAVARSGIFHADDLLFGLGMHPVGDYLAHANLSGAPTWGHQNGINEVKCNSWMWSHEADQTRLNPAKALDTIARFTELWATFFQTVPTIPPAHAAALTEFVLVDDADFGGKVQAFQKAGFAAGDAQELIDLFKTPKEDRHALWAFANSPLFGPTERAAADRAAEVLWLATENDNLLRVGAQDISRAQNKWAALGQVYPPTPAPPPGPPLPDPQFVPLGNL